LQRQLAGWSRSNRAGDRRDAIPGTEPPDHLKSKKSKSNEHSTGSAASEPVPQSEGR
jgi:hypothetical protein